MNKLTFTLIACTLSACATYQAPKQGDPQAILNIDGEASLTAATAWTVYDNPCQNKNDKSGSLAVTGNMSGRHKQVAIRAGEPVYLMAETNSTIGTSPTGTGVQVNIGSCTAAIRFTPENGKTYDTKLAANQCGITLRERQSAREPAGAKLLSRTEWGQSSAVCKH